MTALQATLETLEGYWCYSVSQSGQVQSFYTPVGAQGLAPLHMYLIWVGIAITIVKEEQAGEEARYLLERSSVEQTETANRAIIELVTTIMVYKFEQLSRMEVEQMLGITLKETRVYREIKEEGREEGEQRGEERGREQGERSLILRLLTRRAGELPQEVRQQVESLPLEQLENLGEALLDFKGMADLQAWLNQQNP